MKFSKLGLSIGLALGVSMAAQAADVEVLHYWTSGGEAKSVAELKTMHRCLPMATGFLMAIPVQQIWMIWYWIAVTTVVASLHQKLA